MSRRTPTTPSRSLPAEQYELPTIDNEPEAGPSRPLRTTKPPPVSVRRLTIHAGPSSSVLFSAHPSQSPHQRRWSHHGHGHHRSTSYPESPRNNFLDEDLDYFGGAQARRSEEVQMPNLGHMLGFNPDDEDHYAVAASMGSSWKKRLYLLMEEPSSGREAFYVHIGVTSGIIFR